MRIKLYNSNHLKMEDEICLSCKRDNGVNNLLNCRYCGALLCKNTWNFCHIIDTPIVLTTNLFNTQFKHCVLAKENKTNINSYKFSAYKTLIDFEKEVIKFYVKELSKPIFISFDDIDQIASEKHPNFHHFSSLSLKLTNNTKIFINRNNINLQIFEILEKFLETTDISSNNIISVY